MTGETAAFASIEGTNRSRNEKVDGVREDDIRPNRYALTVLDQVLF